MNDFNKNNSSLPKNLLYYQAILMRAEVHSKIKDALKELELGELPFLFLPLPDTFCGECLTESIKYILEYQELNIPYLIVSKEDDLYEEFIECLREFLIKNERYEYIPILDRAEFKEPGGHLLGDINL